jgi:hypothetical protein
MEVRQGITLKLNSGLRHVDGLKRAVRSSLCDKVGNINDLDVCANAAAPKDPGQGQCKTRMARDGKLTKQERAP